jgi:hypothetical protein
MAEFCARKVEKLQIIFHWRGKKFCIKLKAILQISKNMEFQDMMGPSLKK